MMNMLMTFYAYPLADKIPISQVLNAYLDNPRTPDEITAVREYIENSYKQNSAFNFPPYSEEDIVTLELFINYFRDRFSSKDPFVKKYYQSYSRDSIYDFMARMWIVVRYDDEGEHEGLRHRADQLIKEGQSNLFFLLEEQNPIIKNSKIVADYSYLMSLFIHTQNQDYYGQSFVLDFDSHQFNNGRDANKLLRI
ncbi:hypothetical protein [Nodosilinea nodulosa]|uniref:hypothetical protein n=1 Tax=Nodosilinea nodulosa TaxID=416001 RepID=UPI00038070D6|nr:hypothetical protein [Nodosilinea nodulosa]